MTRRVRTPHMALARLIAQGIFRAELNDLTPDQTMAVLRTAHMVALAGFAQPQLVNQLNPPGAFDQ